MLEVLSVSVLVVYITIVIWTMVRVNRALNLEVGSPHFIVDAPKNSRYKVTFWLTTLEEEKVRRAGDFGEDHVFVEAASEEDAVFAAKLWLQERDRKAGLPNLPYGYFEANEVSAAISR